MSKDRKICTPYSRKLHIEIHTEDIRWATAFYGALISAREYTNLGVNPPFSYSFPSPSPVLSAFFSPSSQPNAKILRAPEGLLKNLDRYSYLVYRSKAAIDEQLHSLKDPGSYPSGDSIDVSVAAAGALIDSFGLVCQPQLAYPGQVGLHAERMLSLLGEEATRKIVGDREIFRILEPDDVEAAVRTLFSGSWRAVFLFADHPVLTALGGCWTGYDSLPRVPQIVSVVRRPPENLYWVDNPSITHLDGDNPSLGPELVDRILEIWDTKARWNFKFVELLKAGGSDAP